MSLMESSHAQVDAPRKPVVITTDDLVFNCPNCDGELVVDREGAGLVVACPHCKKPLTVPQQSATPPAGPAPSPLLGSAITPVFDFSGYSAVQMSERTAELNHQLKENQSQDMEMRGHINRATIELHRLQLKLKKLQERKMIIAAELKALRDASSGAA